MTFKLPERPTRPFLYKVRIRVLNDDRFLKTLPIEAAISYPVPGGPRQPFTLFFFHYILKQHPEGTITRPLSLITVCVDPPARQFVISQYQLAKDGQPLFPLVADPQIGTAEVIAASARTELENALYTTCEKLVDPDFSARAEAANIYCEALLRLENPALFPFYQAINPSLFRPL